MRKRAAAVLVLAAAVWVGAYRPSSPAGGSTVEARVLAQVNMYRARNNLAPLRADRRLAGAALAHARDMAENDFFAHEGSDRTDSGMRARRAGYDWRAVGENIAGGLASPEDTVAGWMASAGHRQNMLNPVFRDAGIGHVFRAHDGGDVRYRHYWTLLLAAGDVAH